MIGIRKITINLIYLKLLLLQKIATIIILSHPINNVVSRLNFKGKLLIIITIVLNHRFIQHSFLLVFRFFKKLQHFPFPKFYTRFFRVYETTLVMGSSNNLIYEPFRYYADQLRKMESFDFREVESYTCVMKVIYKKRS